MWLERDVGELSTFLKKDTFKERVLVPKHQTLVSGMAMGRLEVLKVLLMDADRFFQLLYILGSSLSKSSLGLAVALLSLLRCRVYLLRGTLWLERLAS